MSWDGEDDAPRPPSGPPPRQRVPTQASFRRPLQAVKQEVSEPSVASPSSARDTDRKAKIRALAEEIRAKGRRAAGGEEAETEEAPPEPEIEQDASHVEAMLKSLDGKVTHCEDEIERISILAAPLAMDATDDIQELQLNAIRDTERAVRAAKINIDSAARDVERVERAAATLAPSQKAHFSPEVQKLADRLQESQRKLDEHKSIRKDHEQAVQAEKAFGDLSSRLAAVEMDCDKAAIMAEPVLKALDTAPEDISPTDLRETKEALRIAQAKLAPISRLIAAKANGLKGPILEKMSELQARTKVAQGQLDKAQQTIDEAQSRAAAVPLLKQASERVIAVEEVLEKMRETEAPFLMGIENLPPEEAKPALDKMDKAAALALSAVADAHKYVGLKLVEVGRLAEATANSARSELEKAKRQLDANTERVRKFQRDAGARRKNHVVFSMKEHVETAEAALQRLQSLAGALRTASPDTLTSCLEEAHAAELEAQSALASARREVQERQQEVRPSGNQQASTLKNNSEVLRCKVKVSHIEAEMAKFRRLSQEATEKLKVLASLRTIHEDVNQAEDEAERLSGLAQRWPPNQKPPEEDDRALLALRSAVGAAAAEVEQKLQSSSGLELKELRLVFGRLQKLQRNLEGLKATAQERSRSQYLGRVKEASSSMQQAERKLSALGSAAAKPRELPLDRFPKLLEEAKDAVNCVAEVKGLIAAGQRLQLALEAKVEFARLQARWKAADRKAKTTLSALVNAHQQLTSDSTNAVLNALRLAARRGEGGLYQPGQLFDELSRDGSALTQKQLMDFFGGYGMESGLSEEKVQIALKLLAPGGLAKQAFASLLSDHQRVSRDISITEDFEIQSTKKVRKLEIGEVVELLGSPQKDEAIGLERARCRALSDGASGWVTVRTKAGLEYLTITKRPYLWCADDLPLRGHGGSAEVRVLSAGECLEIVEGPKEERLGHERRLRGVACGEEISGWLQVQDPSGEEVAKEGTQVYKCTAAIAMTDIPDFESCNMLRRIDAGEALELLPDEAHKGGGSERRKFRACKDGAEGWVALTGNQGTVYLKPAKRHYICLAACPVHAGIGAESSVLRVLLPGEAFMAFEDPKDVKGGEQQTIYKVRAVKDGAEGWILVSAGEAVPWSPVYKVLTTTPLTRSLPANDAAETIEVVRVLSPGELVEASEPPIEDGSTGQLRMRCIAKSDMSTGWVTVREAEAAALPLRPAAAEEVDPALDVEEVQEEDGGGPAPLPARSPGGKGKGKRQTPFMKVKEEEGTESSAPWHSQRASAGAKGVYGNQYRPYAGGRRW